MYQVTVGRGTLLRKEVHGYAGFYVMLRGTLSGKNLEDSDF
jgi:hypothetical protein